MLRVRPALFVSDLEAWSSFLEALGMIRTVDQPDHREFDAGGGRISVIHRQTPADLGQPTGLGQQHVTVVFGVEVGDTAEFARRTVADGTPAVVVDDGAAAEVTGRDGFVFRADKAIHGAVCADADPDLAVVGVWLTPDVDGAAQDLRNIGARPRRTDGGKPGDEPDGGGISAEGSGDGNRAVQEADFTAKNGGILVARSGTVDDGEGEDFEGAGVPGAGALEFEYHGSLDRLQRRLADARVEARERALGHQAEVRALELLGPGGVRVMVRSAP